MDKEFDPRDINVTWTEEEMWETVRRRGYTKTNQPTIWGHGFAVWYQTGGREELARARREMWAAVRKLEVELAG